MGEKTNEQRSFYIWDVLPHDADHALSVGRLAHILNEKPRDVAKMIETARHAGKPICSNGRGYWLGSSADEVFTCVNDLNRRIRTQRRTASALYRTGKQMREAEQVPFTQIQIEQVTINQFQGGKDNG